MRPPRTPRPRSAAPRSATPRDRNPAAPQRIAKLLARAGIASRREVERMISEGRVASNGKIIDTPATILTTLDGVTVDGNPVEAPAEARLFLYHKPSGLLVTERDPAGRPTIYDRLPSDLPRLMPVGRLDLNTEGLLLLTTDGELKRQLELPATGVERAYRARAYGTITQAQLEALIEGVTIEGVRYGSINANLERRTGANVWIELILTEGKNREVRRVLEYLGLKVSRLIRTRYGPFLLADLPPDGIGEVRAHDVAAFRKDPTRNPPPERKELPRGRPNHARADDARPAPSVRRLVDKPLAAGRAAAVTGLSPRAARARKHREAGHTGTEAPVTLTVKRPVRRVKESRPGDAEAPRKDLRTGPRNGRANGQPTRQDGPSGGRRGTANRAGPAPGRGKR
ncbi:MAG: pseudouridine synthase [Sphingomonas sp.]